MYTYIIHRILFMIVTVIILSILTFMIIQLPAGDFVTHLAAQFARSGQSFDQAQLDIIREQFGLNGTLVEQYLAWAGNVLQGDLGWSFQFTRPVSEVIGERIGLTVVISLSTLLFTYLLAIPIGVYSATHQYSIGDNIVMFIGFIGLAIPSFLLALILMFVFLNAGFSVGGLFSPEYLRAEWGPGKIWDLMKHLPLPIIIIGTAGTAGLIRVMRASLLDEIGKQYVITARAKGVHETKLLYKYPVRVALNPIASTIGWELPAIVSGGIIVELVLNLPTTGPMLFNALMNQDLFLASSSLLFLNMLTVIGTFLSDILLVTIDPRIRFTEQEG
ncbi:MAG: ABC transporter permease [Rhizobiales bacterium]|nr:ABC transporter permease [Hyphomicrobiales bacterium]NRB13654.1 ABC transporter permease [Hyphomicrobiales bacterium]